jgi:hypothetical protein
MEVDTSTFRGGDSRLSALHEPHVDGLVPDEKPPSPRGIPLGTILGLTASFLVLVVLSGLTALQIRRDESRERIDREALLAESLAPITAEIEAASSHREIERTLSSARRAEAARGRTDFNLVLRDGRNKIVAAGVSGTGDTDPTRDSLQARESITSPLIATGRGTLEVWQDASDFKTEMASRRRSAWFDIGAAILAIIIAVQITIHLLLTRPLRQLMTRIERFEQGYLSGSSHGGSIARELRWLSWRFYRLSISLTNGARLLVAAHRRAMEISAAGPKHDFDQHLLDPLELEGGEHSPGGDIMRRYLSDRCATLEELASGDPAAHDIAREVWLNDTVEAEKLGDMLLRARLEDAALKVLDPEVFEHIRHDLTSLVTGREAWCTKIADTMASALVADGITPMSIQRRVKNPAGVWRKMCEKNLALEDVHDIFAFRVIVADDDQCYLALNTVHRLFEPEPFRFKDYIATPKTNGYRSLHTSVRDGSGLVFEVQIRSSAMHHAAENGDAAHWRYHSGHNLRAMPPNRRLTSFFKRRIRRPDSSCRGGPSS